jgi:glycerol-3-phosphate acyltransferase PlsY
MTAAVALPLAVALMEQPLPVPLVAYTLAMTALIVWTHRANIARMRAGNEHRVRRLWLLRPRDGGR